MAKLNRWCILALAAASVGGLLLAQETEPASPLGKLDRQRVALAQKVRPSVVAVMSVGTRWSNWGHILGNSGFAAGEGGYILTASANVGRSGSADVLLPGWRLVRAHVAGSDSRTGAALLKLEEAVPDLKPLELADSAQARIGEQTYSFGNPFACMPNDDQVAISGGAISAICRPRIPDLAAARRENSYLGPVIETTASVNDGIWGGPLTDRQGRVIGLIIKRISQQRWLGTAVPIQLIMSNFERMKRGEASPAATSGLDVDNAPNIPGAVAVAAVVAGSPAEAAGIKPGDVLVQLDEEKITNGKIGFETLVAEMPVGATVAVAIKEANGLRFVPLQLIPKP